MLFLSSTFPLHQRSAKLFEQSAPSQVRFGEPISKHVKNELTVNASRNPIYVFKYARFVGEAAGGRPGFELFARPRALNGVNGDAALWRLVAFKSQVGRA
jgi:hypothetical protein